MRLAVIVAPVAAAVTALAACAAASVGAQHGTDATSARHDRGTSAATQATYTDWFAYHGNSHRTGYAVTMPTASSTPKVTHKVTLDAAVYAAPIIIKGVTIVATENNTVYAYDSSYRQLWKRHLGSPVPLSKLPCGNINPLGITGTPTYAAVTGLVYVAAEIDGAKPTHSLYGISLSSGAVKFGHSLDLPGVDQTVMQQRGGLMTIGTGVYVPFGGLAGDCGAYKGRVVRYALDGTGAPTSYTVPTSREAGIWTPPGPVYDGSSIFVAVGNGASGSGDPYDHSDSVLKLSKAPQLTDSFSPSTWASDNEVDADLGSQAPALVGSWVFAAGKSGTAYVLRRSHLGGIGGEVSKASLCRSFGGTAVVGSVVYVPCTDGVRAVRISSTGTMQVLWHGPSSATGSPVVGGGRVWSLDSTAGSLNSLDASTGATRATVSVGSVTRFATPAIYGRTMVVPTTTGITVLTTS